MSRLDDCGWLYTDHADGEMWARLSSPPPADSVSEAWSA